jgi:hypothetical protein
MVVVDHHSCMPITVSMMIIRIMGTIYTYCNNSPRIEKGRIKSIIVWRIVGDIGWRINILHYWC